MNRKHFITTLILVIGVTFSSYGEKYTISGYLKDEASGEDLIGASILEKNSLKGAVTNTYGFYSLTIDANPGDSIELIFTYVGFNSISKKLAVNNNMSLDIELSSMIELETVEIVGEKVEKIEQSTKMSTVSLPIEQIKNMPTLLGENDVVKVLQMLPGVQSGNEGSSGLYVRGGGPDQNLILLDGVPVYNASHLFGFFSVFNSDAIKNVELIKGGYPARYGGRLSSVMEINMKEGNIKEYKAEGSIGMISSKLTVEGPIIKDKTSFIISGRRTYADILAQPIIAAANKSQQKTLAPGEEFNMKMGYFFYDLNAKINHKIGKKDRLFLSLYQGDDSFYSIEESKWINTFNDKPYTYTQKMDSRLKWGNRTLAARWNRQFNSKLFMNITTTMSDYRFIVGEDWYENTKTDTTDNTDHFIFQYRSGIRDYGAKIDFDYVPNSNHFIKFGTNYTYHKFSPGVTTTKVTSAAYNLDSTAGNMNIQADERMLYIEDDVRISDRLKMNIGFHGSHFDVSDTAYFSLQPRIAARYLLNNDWAIKASYAEMQQYLHLLATSTMGLPTDLWVPATKKVLPQRSAQTAIGIAKTLNNKYLFSIEGFYRKMDNLIEYKDGASFFESDVEWEDKVETGQGWSRGLEFFIHKKTGKTTGWIGYTLSKTDRNFENINFGNTFPYRYDRRHDISIVFIQKLSKKWDFSASWVFGTGNAVTLPTVKHEGIPDGQTGYGYTPTINYFEAKNDFRMENYHRLDLGLKRHKQQKWGEGTWNFGLYNAYSRANPFFYYFSRVDMNTTKLKRVSLFPILPSISWSFKF